MQPFAKARFLDRRTPPHIGTLILLSGTGAVAMNMFLPSLPAMAVHFETDAGVMQLSVTLYLAMNAVFQIFLGPLSDRFGRRKVTLVSMAIFTLAAWASIYAETIEMFLVYRAIQAASVAGLVLGRAAIRDQYGMDDAASMIGYVTMGMAVVPMVGPAIGGLLEESFGWVSNFWVFAGLGVAMTLLVYFDMGETNRNMTPDMTTQFQSYPELFRARRFWAYCLAAATSAGAYFAYLGGAPFVGAEVYGLDPAALGFYFGAPAVGYLIGNGISGRFARKMGVNVMIMAGASVTASGMTICLILLLSIQDPGPLVFFGGVSAIGLGNGMLLPSATSGMMSVRPHLAGSASGIGGAFITAGGALFAALAGAVSTPEGGALPLVIIMLSTSVMPLFCMAYVMNRERQVSTEGAESPPQ